MKLDLVMRKFSTFDYCGRGAFVYASRVQQRCADADTDADTPYNEVVN